MHKLILADPCKREASVISCCFNARPNFLTAIRSISMWSLGVNHLTINLKKRFVIAVSNKSLPVAVLESQEHSVLLTDEGMEIALRTKPRLVLTAPHSLAPSSPATTCPQPQTDFSPHNPMPLASRLNNRGQRLTATPLRQAMHCDPARDWPADPPPTHITHTLSITGRTLWVRSHKFSGGLFQAGRHYKSLWPPHQHAVAKRNRVMGFPVVCLIRHMRQLPHACTSVINTVASAYNHHIRWIWAMENHHLASNMKNKILFL